jgi:hypothetical protein
MKEENIEEKNNGHLKNILTDILAQNVAVCLTDSYNASD